MEHDPLCPANSGDLEAICECAFIRLIRTDERLRQLTKERKSELEQMIDDLEQW